MIKSLFEILTHNQELTNSFVYDCIKFSHKKEHQNWKLDTTKQTKTPLWVLQCKSFKITLTSSPLQQANTIAANCESLDCNISHLSFGFKTKDSKTLRKTILIQSEKIKKFIEQNQTPPPEM